MRRFGRQVKQRPILVPVQEAIHIGLEQLLRQLLARYPVQYHHPRQNLAARVRLRSALHAIRMFYDSSHLIFTARSFLSFLAV